MPMILVILTLGQVQVTVHCVLKVREKKITKDSEEI